MSPVKTSQPAYLLHVRDSHFIDGKSVYVGVCGLFVLVWVSKPNGELQLRHRLLILASVAWPTLSFATCSLGLIPILRSSWVLELIDCLPYLEPFIPSHVQVTNWTLP